MNEKNNIGELKMLEMREMSKSEMIGLSVHVGHLIENVKWLNRKTIEELAHQSGIQSRAINDGLMLSYETAKKDLEQIGEILKGEKK